MGSEDIRTIAPPLSPTAEKNYPPVRVWGWVKVRVSFRVGGETRQLPSRKIAPRLGLRFCLGLVLGMRDNFPRGQLF